MTGYTAASPCRAPCRSDAAGGRPGSHGRQRCAQAGPWRLWDATGVPAEMVGLCQLRSLKILVNRST